MARSGERKEENDVIYIVISKKKLKVYIILKSVQFTQLGGEGYLLPQEQNLILSTTSVDLKNPLTTVPRTQCPPLASVGSCTHEHRVHTCTYTSKRDLE